MRRLFFLASGVLFCFALPCSARPVKIWAYGELTKVADLVVIAKPVKVEQTADTFGASGWDATAPGVNTTFEVQATLKGAVEGKLSVHHYQYPKGGMIPPNGPEFIAFPTDAKAPSYLLFLKKRADGTYEPVCGQVDPVYACFVLARS